MSDLLERALAGGEYLSRTAGPRRDRMAVRLGAELFGNEKVRRLLVCSICGALGDPGDDCGRKPDGHTLAVAPDGSM